MELSMVSMVPCQIAMPRDLEVYFKIQNSKSWRYLLGSAASKV